MISVTMITIQSGSCMQVKIGLAMETSYRQQWGYTLVAEHSYHKQRAGPLTI
jgi:hypothetical protein